MQLSGTVLRAIEAVLRESERKPADAALRSVLRASGLSAEQKRLVARAVFACFRWQGWLDRSKPLRGRLEYAFELAAEVHRVPEAELLARALPAWTREVMDVTPGLLREFQSEPRLWLRARPGTAAAVAAALGDCEPHPSVPDALWYQGEEDLFRTPEFHQGLFEIQDLSSQIVGHLCAPSPGQTWWDACAGEGGKTLHLGDLMRNQGLVWASDTAQWRLDLLKRRAARARLFNYRVKRWPPGGRLPVKGRFDGALVDAPCSGIGTWGRNPHARWATTAADVTRLAALQQTLLRQASDTVAPGGILVYSVCTLSLAETTGVADTFESENRNFQRLDRSTPGASGSPAGEGTGPAPPGGAGSPAARIFLRPEDWRCGGMFAALWRRN